MAKVIAAERGAELATEVDLREIVPAGEIGRELWRDIECVGEEGAVIGVRDGEAHWRDRSVSLVDGNAGAEENTVLERQSSDLRAGVEQGLAAVKADAGDKMVWVAKQRRVVRRLQRPAIAVGIRRLLVEIGIRSSKIDVT